MEDEAITELRSDALGTTVHSEPGDIADPDAEIPLVPAGQRYDLKATLGEGGMGEVRLCRDRVIGREVALKSVLPSHAGRSEVRERFVREARVQGQLEHPAIVPVYDFGVDGDGQPFFTMKRVRGVTLERVVEALRRGDEATARLYTTHKLLAAFVQVCLAIDFAHERGVLHRDLKPANMMLGGHGEVYVLDWGVAKVRSASRAFDSASMLAAVDASEAGGASAPTAVGAVLGTPGYMAPEQLSGGDVDARTDVYALGGILFELLTLEPLHGGGPLAATMKRAIAGVDARASVRAPHREVAPELEAICVRACSRDPRRRHATARELADAVEAYLNGDRDHELRTTLAAVHLARAREAAARALVPAAPAAERTEALREVGRAVALDPESEAALELLVTLLTQPPKEAPREVLHAIETARRESQRRMLPRVALIYTLSWLVVLPLQAYFGILDGKLIALPIVAWSVAGLGVLAAYRFFGQAQRLLMYQIVAASIALALTSVLFGALVLLPTMVVMSTMGTMLITRRDRRSLVFACNGLALLVPTAMAWLGIHPVTHAVEGDRTLLIGVAAFAISHDGAFAILTVMHVALFIVGAKFAAQYRDALGAAETKIEVQAWQLRQLVPAEAATALGKQTRERDDASR